MNTKNALRAVYYFEQEVNEMLEDAYRSSLKTRSDGGEGHEVVAVTPTGEPFRGFYFVNAGESPCEDEDYYKLQSSHIIADFIWVNVINAVKLNVEEKLDILSNWAKKERVQLPSKIDSETRSDFYTRIINSIDSRNLGITHNQIIAEYCKSFLSNSFDHSEAFNKIILDLRKCYEAERPNVGSNIRNIREAAGISQGVLADIIQTTQSQIAKYERGEQLPSANRIVDIAWALEVNPGDLLI